MLLVVVAFRGGDDAGCEPGSTSISDQKYWTGAAVHWCRAEDIIDFEIAIGCKRHDRVGVTQYERRGNLTNQRGAHGLSAVEANIVTAA
ncbi:MAG: hypothetical protein EXR29_10910 [Betaproteobacteria bacterium]|nr:hypothetical protein [Betaproteobacteria bacterium]